MEPGRHDPDYGVRLIADLYGLTDRIQRGTEVGYPKLVTQNGDAMTWLFLLCHKRAAEGGKHAERGKQIRRNASPGDHLRVFSIRLAEQAADLFIGGKRRKGAVVASPVKEVGIGGFEIVRSRNICGRHSWRKLQSRNAYQLFSVRERQRAQENAVDQTEDCRCRSNP